MILPNQNFDDVEHILCCIQVTRNSENEWLRDPATDFVQSAPAQKKNRATGDPNGTRSVEKCNSCYMALSRR